MNNQDTHQFHIGELIQKRFRSLPQTYTIEWLAEKLNCRPNNVYNIFRRSSIDTSQLMLISDVLGHDFFADLSKELTDLKIQKKKISPQQARKEKKRELYTTIMTGISRLMAREINRMELEIGVNKWAALNSQDDPEASPLPPEQFKVYILGGEDPGVLKHIHIGSLTDRYEVRMQLHNGKFMSVKRKGNRGTTIDTEDLSERTAKWLDMPSSLNPALTNREMAETILQSINPPKRSVTNTTPDTNQKE